MKLHPTAIIDPSAEIGNEVEIGPYSVIGPDVVIGNNSKIQTHVVLEGSVRLGMRNVIGHGAVIGAPPQDLSFELTRKTGVEIGDDNVIREYSTIHRGTAEGTVTRLGNKNFLMAGAHVGHNCIVGNQVIIANNCLLGGHVAVDDGAFLGGGTNLVDLMKLGVATPDVLVDVRTLTSREVTDLPDGGLRIGAGVPNADLATARVEPGVVGAHCEEGLLILDGSIPALGPYVLPGNNYHVYDYALFWGAIRRDAERRLAAWQR